MGDGELRRLPKRMRDDAADAIRDPEALRHVESGQARGKVVITVAAGGAAGPAAKFQPQPLKATVRGSDLPASVPDAEETDLVADIMP